VLFGGQPQALAGVDLLAPEPVTDRVGTHAKLLADLFESAVGAIALPAPLAKEL
jgi:hypothetical protein